MTVTGRDSVYIALGGGAGDQVEKTSRVLYSHDRARTWSATSVPMPRSRSAGIFSMAFADISNGIVVGGDYLNPELVDGNIAITSDGGESWSRPTGTPPGGFRGAVAVRERGADVLWVAVGPTGTDYSTDGGHNWKPASDIGFHAVQFSPGTSAGYACGSDGRVGSERPFRVILKKPHAFRGTCAALE